MSGPAAPFDPVECISLYRRTIADRDASKSSEARGDFESYAKVLRKRWKEWQGQDSLDEIAFGEPIANKLFRQIERLGKSGNLTAAIIHLNDTYIIEERTPMPGMARVAGLVDAVRNAVRTSVGDDRTLVVHSGDFISPSLLSKNLKGKAMLDLLNRLPLNLATLGNHEFDFGIDTLDERLREATFGIVMANLKPPPGYENLNFQEVYFWPEHEPLIAFIGLMSEDVAKSAISLGFKYEPYHEALSRVLQQLKARNVGRLVVLSHFSQSDDYKLLQLLLAQRNCEHAVGDFLILGGHDHDIDWYEYRLSKNLSNCRSVCVFLIPTDSLAWGYREKAESIENELFSSITEDKHNLLVRTGRHPFSLGLELRYPDDLGRCVEHLPNRVADAFARRLKVIVQMMKGTSSEFTGSDGRKGFALKDVFGFDSLSDGDYYGEVTWTGRYPFFASNGDFKFDPDRQAAEAVQRWISTGIPERNQVAATPLRDFSDYTKSLEARDEILRIRSTDFGNFVVDCICNGTAAEVALLNAGAFRVDMQVPAKIDVSLIEETFLFDGPQAVMVVNLAPEELRLMLGHSDKEPGHGRVLQRTGVTEDQLNRGEFIRIAIASFLLCDESDFDGYAAILASARNVDRFRLQQEMREIRQQSGKRIIGLVQDNAEKIKYCDEARFVLRSTTEEERDIEESHRLIKEYRQACEQHGIEMGLPIAIIYPVGNSFANRAPKPLPSDVARTRTELLSWTKERLLQRGEDYMFRLQSKLETHPEYYRTGVPFHSYLYAAIMQFLLSGTVDFDIE